MTEKLWQGRFDQPTNKLVEITRLRSITTAVFSATISREALPTAACSASAALFPRMSF